MRIRIFFLSRVLIFFFFTETNNSTEDDSPVLTKITSPVPREKVQWSISAPGAISPQDGNSERGQWWCWWGGWGVDSGVVLPRGDLISEISLRLTKLSVKQSLVGSRAEGFQGGEELGGHELAEQAV